MTMEVERKFLIENDGWRGQVSASYRIEQGYILAERERSLRARIRTELSADAQNAPECFLTMKFGVAAIASDEFEYPIPYEDARALMKHAGAAVIVKTRHHVEHLGRTWEVDVFEGRHEGLIVAEIEGDDVGVLNNFPDWVGKEVTDDPYYKNASLSRPNP